MESPLALYRRYRPETFADVIGQDHVTTPLRAALAANRVNHAYLFSGPRGCGKTTSARILARTLNCEQAPVADIIRDPVEVAERERLAGAPAYGLPRPPDIFAPSRINSLGLPLSEPTVRTPLEAAMQKALAEPLRVGPLVDGKLVQGASAILVTSPHDRRCRVGSVMEANAEAI